MSVVDNLNQIKSCKENIKQAIIDKGVDMTNVTFTEYASKISEIQTGGGGGDYLDIRENLTTYNSNREYISNYAFIGCNLQSVNLPKCKTVGENAFDGTPLTTISLPECERIEYNAFANSSLTSFHLPKCKSIANNGFINTPLTAIDLPECERVEYNTFNYCYNLTSVNLPVCREIWGSSFCGCNSLTVVEFPKCERLGSAALNNCASLTSVNLPVCKYLEEWAFEFSNALQRVNIPVCSHISENAFGDCQSLTELDLSKSYYCVLQNEDCFYNSPMANGNGSIYVHHSVLEIFRNATNWARYADCFVGVGDESQPLLAFYTDDNGTGTLWGYTEYLTGNYRDAFGISTSQVNLIDLENVIELTDYGMFANNEHIESLHIPSCEKISNRAFANSRIDNIEAEAVKVIDDGAFSGATILFNGVMFPECVEIGNEAFYNIRDIEYENSGLIDVEFSNCKKIGDMAFASIPMNGIIYLPECVEIGNSAFSGSSIEECNIPNCEIIGGRAFYNCFYLNSLCLEKCKKIGEYAFDGCNLNSLELLGDTVVELENMWIGGLSNTTIYVPQELLESYKNDPNWANYVDRIVGA